ncbi:hypothetical protein [Glutamicibacter sp.]
MALAAVASISVLALRAHSQKKRHFKLAAKSRRMDHAYAVSFDGAGFCLGNGQDDIFLDKRSHHVLISGIIQDAPVSATAQEPTL